MRIFILEDDPFALKIADWLEGRNHYVQVKKTLLDAAWFLLDEGRPDSPYDLLLIDISIPGCTVHFSDDRESESYYEANGLNGLRFLLNHCGELRQKNGNNEYGKPAIVLYTANNIARIVDDNTGSYTKEEKQLIRSFEVIDKTQDDAVNELLRLLEQRKK